MSTRPMMACGHRANGTKRDVPVCVICSGIDPGAVLVEDEPVRLKDRKARCTCGETQPSDSPSLAFFEYRGPGSRWAVYHCGAPSPRHPVSSGYICGLVVEAHLDVNPHTGRAGITNHTFVPRGPHEFDSFYCGCRGWD